MKILFYSFFFFIGLSAGASNQALAIITDIPEPESTEVQAMAPVILFEIAGTFTITDQGDGWIIATCVGNVGKCVDIWLHPNGRYDIVVYLPKVTYTSYSEPQVTELEEDLIQVEFNYD